MGKITKRRKVAVIIVLIFLCATLIISGITIYSTHQMNKIPDLTFEEALEYTTKDRADAVITVGIIDNGQSSYKVYGENGKELPTELHTYEIGSLTKTFTAALISRALIEGKINIDSTIDCYLPLPDSNKYPTIKELLTHTSGYKSHYFESPMISNFFSGRNDFYGISKEMVLEKARNMSKDDESYNFVYSNYGYAVLGLVLEEIYDIDYTTLVNDFAQSELGLTYTKISGKDGDLGNYWDWMDTDAYLSAGAITSNISDMLLYAQIQLERHPYFAECHNVIKTIDASTKEYAAMGIHMDGIGMSWIIDSENGIIWHNGGTGNYNSYLGFNPETGTAVVVLSNLAPSYRIPATILGVKRLLEINSRN
ncbi:MAG: beta-lactamase family protein [Oscillibacter sp.]|nr:beta-lactamase family protein [Oscillibacter sp.]